MSETLSFRDLRAAQFPAQNWVISHGLLPQSGLLVVGGAPKSYKSFTVNTLMVGITTGQPVFGPMPDDLFSVPRPFKCLYLEQEIGTQDVQGRLVKPWASLSPEQQELMDANLFVRSMDYDMMLDSEKGCQYVGEIIKSVEPEVLVFDPLVEFWAGDENSSKEMGMVVGNIKKLKQMFNCAVIVVHHTAKPGADGSRREGPHDLRGSSVLFGAGDSFLIQRVVKRLPVGKVRQDFTLRRSKPIPSIHAILDSDNLLLKYHDTIVENDETEQPKKQPTTVNQLVR